jgi:hypothetical protein
MIINIENKKDLKRFIYFVKDLYKDDPHYIYPLFYVLKRELLELVLTRKTYKALLCIKEEKVVGRLLYTFEHNPKLEKDVCYFSYFDAIDSQEVTDELFEYMERDMRDRDVTYTEGTFAPYDPDNRRGVLVNGFDSDPIIFTSYNYDYYQKLLENKGFKKVHDTFSVKPVWTDQNIKKLNTLGKYFERRSDISVDYIDFKELDREIEDIHKILEAATTDVIYQEAPSIELIRSVAVNMKSFLNPKIIRIAREKSTGNPIGFCFCLEDYNQVFKKIKGKLNIIKFLLARRHITRVRGMMQYVVPKYQNTGLIGYIYYKIFEEFKTMGITDFEAGTMMEGNPKAVQSFSAFGGDINKTYRIYGKELD